jgi:nitrile hydratase accessory protein
MMVAGHEGAAVLPGLPLDDEGGPVFQAPWQAQAFAMVVRLHEAGHFTWPEWAALLSEEIETAQKDGDPDLGDTYYLHWLSALERMVAEKGLSSADELSRRKDAWRRAAAATPHGEPIVLPADA